MVVVILEVVDIMGGLLLMKVIVVVVGDVGSEVDGYGNGIDDDKFVII